MSHGDDETESWKTKAASKANNIPSVSQNNLLIPDEDDEEFQAIYVNSPKTQDTFLSENITHVRSIHFSFQKLDSLPKMLS